MKKLFNSFYFLCMVGLLSTALISCDDDNGEDPDPDPGLAVTGINPLTARVGDIIVISGTGFSATPSENTVKFNKTMSAQVVEATITELKVKVPVAAPDGPIEVTVAGKSAASSQSFTLNQSLGAPAITAVDPTHGLVGSTVTLTGTDFVEGATAAEVFFGSTKAEVTESSATSMKVKVPAGLAVGEIALKVTRGGQNSNIVTFVVDALPKTVKATYWTDGAFIYKGTINDTGVNIETLYDDGDGLVGASGIAFNAVDNKVYFIGGKDGSDGHIFRAPADGSGPVEELYTYAELNDEFGAYDLAIDPENSTLYVVLVGADNDGNGVDHIVKANYGDLAAPVDAIYEVNSGGGDAVGVKLTVANGKLYWAESLSKRIMEGSLDGSQSAKVLFDGDDGLGAPYNIAVDAQSQKIFILDNPETGATATDAIWSGNLDGSGAPTKIVSAGANLNGGFDIEADTENKLIIWLTPNEGTAGQKVNRCKYDGTGVETLFSGSQIQGAGFFDIDVR